MGTFLPSEIARLVLGYLEDQKCMVAYNEFLNRCNHLVECRGREFFTTIMGLSLNDILDDYCAVHSYVRNIRCDGDFKNKVAKCQRLLDKVKLITEDKQLASNNNGKQLSRSLHGIHHAEVIEDCPRRVLRRNNSCDSVVTIKTEKSYECNRAISDNMNVIRTNYSKLGHLSGDVDCDRECSAEATNLEDLPGYGDDGSYWNDVRMTKSQRRIQLLRKNNPSTGFTANSKLSDGHILAGAQLQNDNSIDCNLTDKKLPPHPSSMEFDFRKALGLVKQSDTPQYNVTSKSPSKRKHIKSKLTPSVRKVPHSADSFPNESLNVTTITNAMLDCKELHEIIADNINKIYNLSTTKPMDSDDVAKAIETSRNEMLCPKPTENDTDTNIITIDDDLPEFENVIKSIVEKTEKEPLFDQLLNDVLAASIESTSGTESDVVSRPDTSTPEKSMLSLAHESSPASSNRSPVINSNKKSQLEEQSKWRKKRMRDTPHTHDNIDGKANNLQSTSISPILPSSFLESTQTNDKDTKKYVPRYPRGGKKMEVLKENYKKVIGKDKRLSVPVSHRLSRSAAKALLAKPDPKVIILSNEVVHTNLLIDKGPIVSQKADRLKDNIDNLPTETHQINSVVPMDSETHTESLEKKIENTSIPSTSKCQQNSVQVINSNSPIKHYQPLLYHSATPLNQNAEPSNNPHSQSQHNVVITMPNNLPSNQQNFTAYYNSYHPGNVISSGNPNVFTSAYVKGGESWQKQSLSTYGCTVTGKPPELIISNGKVTSGFGNPMNSMMEPVYSKSEIMDMPTIFVIQPTSNSTVASSYIEVPKEMQFNLNYSQPQSHVTAVKEVKQTKTKNLKILPKITCLNDIVTVLDLENHCDQNYQTTLKCTSPTRTEMRNITPRVEPAAKDSSVSEKDECSQKPDLNTDILSVRSYDSSEGGRFVIDEDQKKNATDCPDLLNVNKSLDTVESSKSKDSEFEFSKRKTPDVLITKKMSFSTPRRNFSHVRVLDFNTPSSASNQIVSRKAFTSPKLPATRGFNKALQTPSVNKNVNLRSKMKNVKSCLFQHPEDAEEQANVEKSNLSDAPSAESVEPKVSEVWDEIQGVSQIIKHNFLNESNTTVSESQSCQSEGCISYIDSNLIIGKKTITDSKKSAASSWDLNLRKMVGSALKNTIPSKHEIKENARRKFRKIEQSRKSNNKKLTDSLKKEAKLLERALLNKSLDASPGPSNNVTNQNKIDCDKIEDESLSVGNRAHELIAPVKNGAGVLDATTEEVVNTVETENTICASKGFINSVKPVSENSHPSNDSSNSRDHLINLKFKRDAYTKTNLLKKEVISPIKVTHPNKVKLKSNQSKSTFKVKFTSKNHTNSLDDSQDKKLEKYGESKSKSKSKKSSKSRSKIRSKVVPKVEVAPPVAPSAEAEPPVPAVKITPDMPRGSNCNPVNAKYNLASLLETPLKTIMMDLSMDTPKFLDHNFGEPVSVLKILDIPTPNFVNTPSVSSWFAGKVHTPGSCSSRPTDYSGGSSYYKPDEIEDVNYKVGAITASKTVEQLSIINEEPVHTPEDGNLSTTRVLRPRVANTNKSIPNPSKQQEIVLTNSNDKSNESVSRARKPSFSDSNSKSSDSDSSASCSCSFPSSSSSEEQKSPVKQLINKARTPKKNFLASKTHFTSTPISTNASSQQSKIDKQINKCKNKENDSAHNQHDSLEEKRLRVLSKLSTENKKDLKKTSKLLPNTRSPVSRVINRNKSITTTSSSKSSVRGGHQNDSKKRLKNIRSPVKRLGSQKVFSPSKKTPVKRFLPRKAKSKTTRKTVRHDILSNLKSAEEFQSSNEVKTVDASLPISGILKPVITKSRRKSSTPRKLEKVMFEPANLDCSQHQKDAHAKLSQLAKNPSKIHIASIQDVKNANDASKSNVIQMNGSDCEMKSGIRRSACSPSVDGEDYPSLHLSSDEAETELTPQTVLSTHSADECYDNIMRINEYIANSASEKPKTIFQANLVKEGFDSESAKRIEKDLTDSVLDDESLLGSPVVNREPEQLSKADRLTGDVDHPSEESIIDIGEKQNSPSRNILKVNSNSTNSSFTGEQKKSLTTNCNIFTTSPESNKSPDVVSRDSRKKMCSLSHEVPEAGYSGLPSIANVIPENNQPGVENKYASNTSDEIASSLESDSKFSDDAYLWSDYECAHNDVNYVFMSHDKVSKSEKNDSVDDSFSDISKFTLNATIGDDEVRVITVSEYVHLFEIASLDNTRSKVVLKSEKEISKKRRRHELIAQCFNEVSNSSFESLSPIKKSSNASSDETYVSEKQSELTGDYTLTVLSDNLEKDVASTTTTSEGELLKLSRSDESLDDGTVAGDGNKSVKENFLNTDEEVSSKSKLTSKRKLTEGDDSEESDSKKVKPSDAQHLFKQIDIESILSKLHGPQQIM